MKTQLYYFSGTGNSLHVAAELQKRLGEAELIPIMGALDCNLTVSDTDAAGFIFPIHAFTMPRPVEQFIKTIKFTSNPYLFAVATRGGSPCKVFKQINNSLKHQNKSLDAQFFINMPNNYTPFFDAPTEAEISAINLETLNRIEFICERVINKQDSKEKDPHGSIFEENLLFPVLSKVFKITGYFNAQNNFYVDSKCTGCGLCSEICLSGKIKMQEAKPHWNKCTDCVYCFACLHYCPVKAIQLKHTKSAQRGRYHHKEVKAQEIALQKKI